MKFKVLKHPDPIRYRKRKRRTSPPKEASRLHARRSPRTCLREPDNPEVSSRLTNLSLRHAGSRPEWFDFEPLALPGRTRQCRKLYWQIAADQNAGRKRMLALGAPSGMGKTAFLSELYAMLEHAPHNVLTLAPNKPVAEPFYALKRILEQRFYISEEASFECVRQYVTGAVSAIISPKRAAEVSEALLALWRPEPKASDAEPARAGNGDDTAANEADSAPKSQTSGASDTADTSGDTEADATSNAAETPPTKADKAVTTDHADTPDACATRRDDEPPSPPCEAKLPEAPRDGSLPKARITASMPCMYQAALIHSLHDIRNVQAVPANAEPSEPEHSVENTKIALPPYMESDRAANDAKGAEGAPGSTLDLALSDLRPQLSREDEILLEIELPFAELLEADLRRNALVIMFDDVERFDRWSIEALARAYERIPSGRLTILMTTDSADTVPDCLKSSSLDYMELHALSDLDLTRLTQHILEKLSAKREKLIVPKDVCTLIAQKSYGSPKRAIDLTLKYFNPDSMIHWNESIDLLHRESIPKPLGIHLIRRFRTFPELDRQILQLASHLNAPFTVSTIECMISTWPEFKRPENFQCAAMLHRLRENGFLEHAEESFGTNTPTYVFKHNCERQMISSSVSQPMRQHIYNMAAQWYSLNNATGIYDEVIGDLWRSLNRQSEACHYYERAAYRALNSAQLPAAWTLFRKLLKCLPEERLALRIQTSLDGSRVAFRLGQVDEAFQLCRHACHNAIQLSAYTQAARANIQIADMLLEMGSIRHIMRYISRAQVLLNREGDSETKCRLYYVLSRRALFMGQYSEARRYLDRARALGTRTKLKSRDKLLLDWTDAEIDAQSGDPKRALQLLKDIIMITESTGDIFMRTAAYHTLGHLHESLDNLAGALEAWNHALGMVQEMNDTIMHANLLADISDGALALEARKTARATTEQCLGLAQQTHQKTLIARCLANTAYLQHANGQHEKAIRTLRKAHRSALALRALPLWIRTLSFLAYTKSDSHCPQHSPAKARQIYRRMVFIFDRHGMQIEKARFMPRFADFLLQTHQDQAALNALRISRAIYQKYGLDKARDKIQARIDELSQGK
ncbi:MAG: hypothetical protein IKY83_00215 [Proteobacteria bacterium]|nr:hypothetical protein [Pseudomonadota bacterium]